MARLKVKHNGKLLQDIPLDPGKIYVAGRKEDCDIPLLAEKTISREHFHLLCKQNEWQLEVVSRFGELLFQNEKVQNLPLTDSLVFHIPPYEFDFIVEAVENRNSSLSLGAHEVNEDRTFVGRLEQVPFIKFIGSDRQETQLLRLEGGDAWLAGRDSSSAIPIKDQRVSRRQFEIRKTDSGYGIIDLGSVNGTLLNGNNISSTDVTPLRSGDAITVLDNTLYFELHDPNFMERVQNVDYDQVSRALVETTPVESFPPPAAHGNYPVADPGIYGPDPYAPYGNPGAAQPPPVQAENFLAKLKAKKLQVVIGVLAVVLVAGMLMDNTKNTGRTIAGNSKGNPNDPFNRLSKEQQILVKQSFQLAQSYYESDNSELCRAELSKIREVMPEYKKSFWAKDIENLDQSAEQKIFLITKQKEFEAKEKMLAEQEHTINEVTSNCKLNLKPQTTREEFEACISPAVTLNPTHHLLETLRAEFALLEMQMQKQSQDKKEYQEQAEKLQRLFSQAERIDKNENMTEAIEAYRKVTNSKLADPKNLKSRAQRILSSLKSQIGTKTAGLLAEAEKLAQNKNYKQAIINLRMARKVNPQSDELNDKIDNYVKALQKEMKILWDEAIIEESFGKVMPDENNSGAIGKWKKILEQDIPDGNFYQKAMIKLKKYGAN